MDKVKEVKKALVLGMRGMLGNAVYLYLGKHDSVELLGTETTLENVGEKKSVKALVVDKDFLSKLEDIIDSFRPDYIVNCIGIIRPVNDVESTRSTFLVNSYFPRIVALICRSRGIRMIHFSTDCVFSGKTGEYTEEEIPDEIGVYGMSKFLGEVNSPPNLTIRTSIIGKEAGTTRNLLDWFLSQRGKRVDGYSKVFWNGVTTITLAKIVSKIITEDIKFEKGLIHIAGEKVSKLDLLRMAQKVFDIDCTIIPVDEPVSDKTIVPSTEQDLFTDMILPLENQLEELREFYNK